jgi:hypothetical protein
MYHNFDLTDTYTVNHAGKVGWLGLVEISQHQLFSALGDFGSLVYAVQKNQTIPLGIHIGLPYLDYPE